MTWQLRLLASLLPCVPVVAGSIGLMPDGSPAWRGRWLWVFAGVWIAGAITASIWGGKREPLSGAARAAFIAYFAGSAVPALLTGLWVFGAPYLHLGSIQFFAASCLLPLLFCIGWASLFDPWTSNASRAELALPGISVTAVLIVFGVATEWVFASDPFQSDLALNGPDRSYWYITQKSLADGTNGANSYGFLGPEPAVRKGEHRILVIGDSIPDAGRSVNFPDVAEQRYEQMTGRPIEIVNASIAGYSVDQMHHYYADKLEELDHDVLLVSFYIDDVNRELRYRKNNFLYTPSWPEWTQDVYYHCWLCRRLLGMRFFDEATFLAYRTTTIEDALPSAITTLSRIQTIANARGARLALINMPVFRWSGVLADANDYEFIDAHRQIEQWCRDRDVAYLDLLPALASRDIGALRLSDSNIHFNDEGHRLIGAEMTRFVISLL